MITDQVAFFESLKVAVASYDGPGLFNIFPSADCFPEGSLLRVSHASSLNAHDVQVVSYFALGDVSYVQLHMFGRPDQTFSWDVRKTHVEAALRSDRTVKMNWTALCRCDPIRHHHQTH